MHGTRVHRHRRPSAVELADQDCSGEVSKAEFVAWKLAECQYDPDEIVLDLQGAVMKRAKETWRS